MPKLKILQKKAASQCPKAQKGTCTTKIQKSKNIQTYRSRGEYAANAANTCKY
jgi:hypothetical protein